VSITAVTCNSLSVSTPLITTWLLDGIGGGFNSGAC